MDRKQTVLVGLLRRMRAQARGSAALSPEFRNALEVLSDRVSGHEGIVGPPELLMALLVFDSLWEEGEFAGRERVAQHLIRSHGWEPWAAEQAAYTWEVVVGLRNLWEMEDDGLGLEGETLPRPSDRKTPRSETPRRRLRRCPSHRTRPGEPPPSREERGGGPRFP